MEQNRSGTYTQIVYAPSGFKLALMNGQTLNKAFVPLPGGATAVYNSGGLAYYRHPDWLGSSRLASKPDKTIYSTTAYAPFGETYAQSGTTDVSFTGQNADTTSDVYDFLFRENHPVEGRWLSPDPAGVAGVDSSSPQSWNRYAYVLNSPATLIDPLGFGCTPDDPCKLPPPDLPPNVCDHPIDPVVWAYCNNIINLTLLNTPTTFTGGGGGGQTTFVSASPTPLHPVKSNCHTVSPVLGALELKLKIGPEVQAGPFKLGGALYKNVTTGEAGGEGSLGVGPISFNVDSPTPNWQHGGSFGSGGPENNRYSFDILGFRYDFTTGKWSFQPSKNFGFTLLAGVDISFNPDTFNDILDKNLACIANGGS